MDAVSLESEPTWKTVARDAVCMLASVVVITVLVTGVWLVVTLWVLPRAGEKPLALGNNFDAWAYAPLYAPLFAPIVVAFACVGVFLYAALRGRARRGKPIAPPYWRDTLLVPLMVGVALGLGSLVVAVLTGGKEDAVTWFLVGLAQALPLCLAALLVVLVQRFTSRAARTLAFGAAALIATWLGARLVLDAWGGRMVAAYKAVAMNEIAAERQRIAAERLPVLFGAPIEDNAAERYRSLTEAIAGKMDLAKAWRDINAAVRDGPGRPRSSEAAQWVAVSEPELRELREAVRCTRCDWQYPWEQGFEAPFPSLLGAREAASLLVIEGYQHAEVGDVEGAAERDLEVIRMGRDYEGACALIGTLMAVALEGVGTDALLRLIATDGLAAPPAWDTIQSKVDLLEPRLARMSVGYRGERLAHVGLQQSGYGNQVPAGWPNLSRLFDSLLPGRLLLADGVRTFDDALREMERASDLANPREAERISQAAVDRGLRSSNPIVHIGLPSLSRARSAQDRFLARFRLLRAAVQLEKSRGKGRYPEDASAIDLPIDSFGYPARLHYASLAGGTGYRVWSVGENGKDDGGIAKDGADEVFERPPRADLEGRASHGSAGAQPQR